MRFLLPVLFGLLTGCDGKEKPDDSSPVDDSEPAGGDLDGDGFDADDDCNDADAQSYPGAPEIWYDGIDQACDGGDDFDQDGDGLQGGSGAGGGPDCDDTDADVYPGAPEVCDGIDQDCDAAIDEEAVDALDVYVDADGDGFGVGEAVAEQFCEPPLGTALQGGDCADEDGAVYPGAAEVCNGVDDDCSGFVDDNATDGARWYADFDADGYGDPANPVQVCGDAPAGYLADSTDCDDTDPSIRPDASEVCDGIDEDCDGAIDDDAIDPLLWYGDGDGDGDGDAAATLSACTQPAGYVPTAGDCDDADSARNSAAYESCDGVDNDCDGETDTDSPDATAWHPDLDGDGFGDAATSVRSCDLIAGWTADGSDCDDGDGGNLPGGIEVCDGADNNCDGVSDEDTAVDASLWYADADTDLFGDPGAQIFACELPDGYTDNAEDCNDSDPSSNPASREFCDGIDNDCDGDTDESDAFDAQVWYRDVDSDGYGGDTLVDVSCAQPAGAVADTTDCDDGDSGVYPGSTETQDLVDEDCDGLVDEDFILVGDIVVSEIARQPYAGGSGTALNPQAQWFEVYNSSSADINLSGWYFEEQDGDRFVLSPSVGLVIPAGGYAVLCYNDDWFGTPAVCDYTWGDASLGASYSDTTFYFDRPEDLIAIYLNGLLMDEVHWYDVPEGDGDVWPAQAHYSMQLSADALSTTANDDAGAWCLAGNTVYTSVGTVGHPDRGTPAAANQTCN